MSQLDISKTQYTSLFQGLGNLPLLEYEFDIPQIPVTNVSSGVWTIPSSSQSFTIPLERSDVMTSLLFSIRDVNTNLNLVSSVPAHSWSTSILDTTTSVPAEYLSRFESMRSLYETRFRTITIITGGGPPVFDYFRVVERGLYEASFASPYPLLTLRARKVGQNLVIDMDITAGQLDNTVGGANTPTIKAIAASKLYVRVKRYIAPWNV